MRIALPKGRLLEQTSALLRDAGIGFTFAGERDYSPSCSVGWLTAKLVKVRAVPQLVALGNFDAGFCGIDLVRDCGYDEVVPLQDLGLNPVRLVVAAPRGQELLKNPPKRPLVIATEYESLATRWAHSRGLAHIVLQTWGSTEGYAPDDADLILDCVETGATLSANGLEVIETIMASTTWLVAGRTALADPGKRAEIEALSELLKGRSGA